MDQILSECKLANIIELNFNYSNLPWLRMCIYKSIKLVGVIL